MLVKDFVAGTALDLGIFVSLLPQQRTTELDPRDAGIQVLGRERLPVDADRFPEERFRTRRLIAGKVDAPKIRHGGPDQIVRLLAVHVAIDRCHSSEIRGGIIERVGTWRVEHVVQRVDSGWTADDVLRELPRIFGAAPKIADKPPSTWKKPPS